MNKKLILITGVFTLAINFIACTASSANSPKMNEQPKVVETKTENNTSQTKSNDAAKTETKTEVSAKTNTVADKSACLSAKIEGKKLIADQTFVFDYEPFPKSCFVTFANKEDMLDDKDLPRGSTFYIFRNGEQVYDFQDAFDEQPACWVEGVGFEDLNGDGKTEIIIAGKCLGAKNAYPMNAVYLNIRDDFQINQQQNRLLDKFTTIGEIKNFVKKNQDKFF
jgi:hypothetical protein